MVYPEVMTTTTLIGSILMILTTITGCVSTPSATDRSPQPSMRIYDLPVEVDGQQYACKVIVNEHATLGGPALLFLHGAGECGTDGVRQTHVGLPRYASEFPEMWPYVLIVPQKPSINSEWEDHDAAITLMLEQASAQGLYDPDRLAITGLSQGGHGTITIASMHPDRFKAAAPVCAYTLSIFDQDRQRIERQPATPETPAVIRAAQSLAAMPTWIHHGDSDVVVPVAESRSLYAALQKLDADTRYSEYPGVNHNSWDNAYTDQQLSDWFAEHLGE